MNNDLLRERTGNKLMLIAHRGLGPTSVFGPIFPEKFLPENSLESIKAAILQGADAIEVDIFKTGDGVVVVSHDSEIWRNEFNMDRNGDKLPPGETKETYLIGRKNFDELKQLSIGHNGETIPALSEVISLVNCANRTLAQYDRSPVVLNIELKDASAVSEMLDLIDFGAEGDNKILLENVIFCSFNHDALKELKAEAERRGMLGINIAAGIKTADLFGKENINKDFSLKEVGLKYQAVAMDNLRAIVEGNGFQGYDGVLWDLREPIVDLAVSGGKAIHASTSDFRQYNSSRDFALILLELSKRVDTFFKCDNVEDARKVLLESSILLDGIGVQMMYKQTSEGEDCFYFYKSYGQQDNSDALIDGVGKPQPYSQLQYY
ncbi:glycerophosphoryl diester phosphodiesterase [Pseudomonas sp. NFACC37-1]|nr:glycerophosphoryl diester phosphodiesterase [Pseudomonas sp. NFACC37-1]